MEKRFIMWIISSEFQIITGSSQYVNLKQIQLTTHQPALQLNLFIHFISQCHRTLNFKFNILIPGFFFNVTSSYIFIQQSSDMLIKCNPYWMYDVDSVNTTKTKTNDKSGSKRVKKWRVTFRSGW